MFLAERAKDDDVVDAVEELGLEMRVQQGLHLLAGFLKLFRRAHLIGLQITGAEVRGHDDDRVLEIDDAAFAVGQSAVVHHLQEHVEDVGMSFFNFVEEHDCIRTAANLLGELAAFFVADVSRRRADQARDRVFLHVFGHVDAQQSVLVVEQKFGEGACQLRLAHAGWAEEDEGADRTLGITESRARPANGIGHPLQSRILANDAQAQAFLHGDQLFHFAFQHL